MSWYSKVVWAEGLFPAAASPAAGRPLSRAPRGSRVRHITPYPWGFSYLEIDRDLTQQSKFSVRRAAGVMPDGTPFDIPGDSPLPDADRRAGDRRRADRVAVHAGGGPQYARGRREVSRKRQPLHHRLGDLHRLRRRRCASRRESTSPIRGSSFELRKTPKPGYVGLGIARILEVRDKTIVFDEKYVPPLLVCAAHPVVDGWIDRVIGWIDNKLEELVPLRRRSDRRRRPAKRRLSRAATSEPDHPCDEAHSRLRLRASGAPVPGIPAAGRRACDLRNAANGAPATIRPMTTTISKMSSRR